jgi:hypothetical protein
MPVEPARRRRHILTHFFNAAIYSPRQQLLAAFGITFVISAPAHARDKFPLIAWLSAVHFINGPALEFGGSTAAVRPKAGVEGAS